MRNGTGSAIVFASIVALSACGEQRDAAREQAAQPASSENPANQEGGAAAPLDCGRDTRIDASIPGLVPVATGDNYELYAAEGVQSFGHNLRYAIRFTPRPHPLFPPDWGEFSAVIVEGAPASVSRSIESRISARGDDMIIFEDNPGPVGWFSFPFMAGFSDASNLPPAVEEMMTLLDARSETYAVRAQAFSQSYDRSPWQTLTLEGANTDVSVVVCTGAGGFLTSYED